MGILDRRDVVYPISKEDFKESLAEVLRRKVEAREMGRIAAAIRIRRLDNGRVLERVYRRTMENMPKEVAETADSDDIFAFLTKLLDWLTENLPQILALFAMF